jgi:hypothetical protein
LTRANEDTEEEVLGLKSQIDQLKKSSPQVSVSASANVSGDDTKKLRDELRDKDEKV